MSRRTIFRRVARDDVRAARRWHEERRSGLGAAFVRSLEVCIAQIERTPELWPRVDGETRRGRLRRFPYVVYYALQLYMRNERVIAELRWVVEVLRNGGTEPRSGRIRARRLSRCESSRRKPIAYDRLEKSATRWWPAPR